jgi:hypothetical protein
MSANSGCLKSRVANVLDLVDAQRRGECGAGGFLFQPFPSRARLLDSHPGKRHEGERAFGLGERFVEVPLNQE